MQAHYRSHIKAAQAIKAPTLTHSPSPHPSSPIQVDHHSLSPTPPPHLPSPAPMDIDLNPHSLYVPDDLAPFGLGLNPTHLILICTSCHTGIRRTHIHSHFKSFHKDIYLPDPDTLTTILDTHHIKLDADVVQPTGLIAPIQGIRQERGYRCKVAECGYTCISFGVIKKHLSNSHPRVGVQREFMEECLVQTLFQVYPHYFPVLGDLAAFDPNDLEIDVAAYNQLLIEEDTFVDPIAHAPANPRFIHQFHRHHEWFPQIEGHHISTLVASVALPKEDYLKGLSVIVKGFFGYIAEQIVENLDFTVRRWLLSEKG